MRHRQSLAIFLVAVLTALFGLSCKSFAPLSRSSERAADAKKIRTTVTRDNLKARLAGNKVKFIETEEDLALPGSGKVARRELRPLTLKIVSIENEPNVEFNGRVSKLHELAKFFKDVVRELDRLTLPATEADMAFYNSKGISVEDFEEVIRSLDESVKEFAFDFLGQPSPDESARSTPTPAQLKLKDDEPPPPARTPSPLSNRAPVSGGDLTNRAISRVEPTYPPVARKFGISGPVTVKILVDEDGNVVSASPISGQPLLQSAAVTAVRQWRFTPATVSGQRVRTSGTVTVNFKP